MEDTSREVLARSLSDQHSKGTSYSCAVVAKDLTDFLDSDDLGALRALFQLEAIGASDRLSRFVDALLTAGARMVVEIPDFNTLVPPLQKE